MKVMMITTQMGPFFDIPEKNKSLSIDIEGLFTKLELHRRNRKTKLSSNKE
jgi:hypothetical protein